MRVQVEHIEWIEAAKDYVFLHTDTRPHIYRARMCELQARLDPRELTRVHRSTFARLDRAVEVRRKRAGLVLTLESGRKLAVGKKYVEEVERRLGIQSARRRSQGGV